MKNTATMILMLTLVLAMLLGATANATESSDGALGYDDEAGYGGGRLEFVEGVSPADMTDEYVQATSDGLYIREKMSEDGIVVVVNRNFPPLADVDNLEQAIELLAIEATEGAPIQHIRADEADWAHISDFQLNADEAFSAQSSYPSYLATWRSGENEDARDNVARVVLTDASVLMYRFGVSADFYEDYAPSLFEVLDALSIDFLV